MSNVCMFIWVNSNTILSLLFGAFCVRDIRANFGFVFFSIATSYLHVFCFSNSYAVRLGFGWSVRSSVHVYTVCV